MRHNADEPIRTGLRVKIYGPSLLVGMSEYEEVAIM